MAQRRTGGPERTGETPVAHTGGRRAPDPTPGRTGETPAVHTAAHLERRPSRRPTVRQRRGWRYTQSPPGTAALQARRGKNARPTRPAIRRRDASGTRGLPDKSARPTRPTIRRQGRRRYATPLATEAARSASPTVCQRDAGGTNRRGANLTIGVWNARLCFRMKRAGRAP